MNDAPIHLTSPLTSTDPQVTAGATLAGFVNAIFIAISNAAYQGLAGQLNDWENHRTQTAFEDALIVKAMLPGCVVFL